MAVVLLRPRAAGSLAQMTPSAGTNHACSGDQSDATSVSAAAINLVDLYLFDALPPEAYSIDTVRVVHRQNGTAASSSASVCKLGATTVVGATVVCTGADADVLHEFVTKPGGGSWLPSDFDTVEAGQKSISVAGGAVTSKETWIEVQYSEREVAPKDPGTDMTQAEVLRADPVRIDVTIALAPADVDFIDDVATKSITFGPVQLGGQAYATYFTLSRNSVVNLGD